MTKDEIRAMTDCFVHAAKMVKEAGIDGVEIHSAHGYLLSEFLSPYWNKREDQYGGSLENRMRFTVEVAEAVRDAVGSDFVVGMRVSGDEFVTGGYTLDDLTTMAPIFTKAGKLDYLNVSVGTNATVSTIVDPMYYPLNSFVYCAAAIKEVVDIPVFARGRIVDPVQAEEILANNQADMVSMVRATIADPEFAGKAREGRLEEIAKCLGCNEGCWGGVARPGLMGAGIGCTMNAAAGREGEPGWGELEPAAVKKRVMIIGGGPAGLESARVAARRGHRVSLYERGPELGGQSLIAARAPGRDGFSELPRYYTHQMKLLGVDVQLNHEATAGMVKKQDPDAVVVATGSVPHIPHIPGVGGGSVVEAREVLMEEVEVGGNVIVLGFDNDIQSLSVAQFLAERGKCVEVLGFGYDFGVKLESATRQAAHQRLFQHGVTLTPHTGVKEICDHTVIAFNVLTHEERRIEGIDTVVIGCGGQENNALYYALKDHVKEIYLVGDANGVRRITDATLDGATVGRVL
jgi:NADPH-dependent 2,4-dienoyl-CoA reductase/sulfur reductase-like enzyme